MKKFKGISKLLVTLMVMVATVVLLPHINAEAATAKVTADSAYIRSNASTSGSKVSGVSKGDTLDVISQEKDTSGYTWYKVYVDANTTGYIRGDLISVDGSVPESKTPSKTETTTSQATSTVSTEVTVPTETEPMSAKVNNTVNVRAGASTGHAIVASAKKNTAVTVIGYATGKDNLTWYQVNYQNGDELIEGYIRNDFVQLDGELVDKVEEVVEEVEEEPVVEEEPEAVYKDYEAIYDAEEDTWYLYNYIEGSKVKLNDLYDARTQYQDAKDEVASVKLKKNIVIIILSVVIVLFIVGAIYAYINFRRWYYGYGETEEPVVKNTPEKNYDRVPEKKNTNNTVVKPTASTVKPQTIGGATTQAKPQTGLPAGAVKLPDGRVQLADGSIRKMVTGVRLPDGTIKLTDGRIQLPDGTVKYPDGSVKLPDGRIVKPEVTLAQPETKVRTGMSLQETREIPVRKTAKLTQDDDDMEFGFLNLDDKLGDD